MGESGQIPEIKASLAVLSEMLSHLAVRMDDISSRSLAASEQADPEFNNIGSSITALEAKLNSLDLVDEKVEAIVAWIVHPDHYHPQNCTSFLHFPFNNFTLNGLFPTLSKIEKRIASIRTYVDMPSTQAVDDGERLEFYYDEKYDTRWQAVEDDYDQITSWRSECKLAMVDFESRLESLEKYSSLRQSLPQHEHNIPKESMRHFVQRGGILKKPEGTPSSSSG